jgi:hypothetical protein
MKELFVPDEQISYLRTYFKRKKREEINFIYPVKYILGQIA